MTNVPDNVHLDWSLLGNPIRESINSLRADIESYAKSRGGAWLTPDIVKEIDHALDRIDHAIRDSRPWARCPQGKNCVRGCRICDGAGFVPRRLASALEKKENK